MDPIVNLLYQMIYRGLEKVGRYYSSYRGFVMDNEDPDGYNRLQLKVPQVYGNQIMTYWAWPKGNFNGPGYGSKVTPQKGDFVWVEFEMGDTRRPIWGHGHFGSPDGVHDIPEVRLRSPNIYWFKTPGGHTIELDDDTGVIVIKSSGDIAIQGDTSTIDISDAGINIDSGDEKIYLGGSRKLLFAKSDVSTEILDVSEIGVSDNVFTKE